MHGALVFGTGASGQGRASQGGRARAGRLHALALGAATSPRMAAVDLERQRIERRDFPVSRRGYDPAAVDAHLRDLADALDERERQRAAASGPPSLASEASAQVQSILSAAEAAAADIERQALESAKAER